MTTVSDFVESSRGRKRIGQVVHLCFNVIEKIKISICTHYFAESLHLLGKACFDYFLYIITDQERNPLFINLLETRMDVIAIICPILQRWKALFLISVRSLSLFIFSLVQLRLFLQWDLSEVIPQMIHGTNAKLIANHLSFRSNRGQLFLKMKSGASVDKSSSLSETGCGFRFTFAALSTSF